MKHTIELSIDDINRIVVSDLQDAFKWHIDDKEAQRELLVNFGVKHGIKS